MSLFNYLRRFMLALRIGNVVLKAYDREYEAAMRALKWGEVLPPRIIAMTTEEIEYAAYGLGPRLNVGRVVSKIVQAVASAPVE